VLDFNNYKVLTFDCYGTLIDWEKGILEALKPLLLNYNIRLDDNQILELYAKFESAIEKRKFIEYKEVLRKIIEKFSDKFGFSPSSVERNCLVDSLKNWKPFPDTVNALERLKKKYKLAIISNVDDDLFAFSEHQLEVKFDYIITAEQVKSYKPSLNNFKFAIAKIGVAKEAVLHIAQSIYHDIIPAKTLGLSTIWVNRRKGKSGMGATLSANEEPDLEVPDLRTLVEIMESELQ
jgi:2-haloacid dehalogenase